MLFLHFSLTHNCSLLCENPKGHHGSKSLACCEQPTKFHLISCHYTSWPWAASPRVLKKAVQILEAVVLLSFYFVMSFTRSSGAECGPYGSPCPRSPMSVRSLSSVMRGRHRGSPISEHVRAGAARMLGRRCVSWDLHSTICC